VVTLINDAYVMYKKIKIKIKIKLILQADGCLIVVTHIKDLKIDLGQTVELGDVLQVSSLVVKFDD
jgi:nucleoside 2-deoxyribosyltransferase